MIKYYLTCCTTWCPSSSPPILACLNGLDLRRRKDINEIETFELGNSLLILKL